jgi:hypothetical protein
VFLSRSSLPFLISFNMTSYIPKALMNFEVPALHETRQVSNNRRDSREVSSRLRKC